MVWVVAFIAAAALVGGVAQYASIQASTPRLQHRPGTPIEVVESCRQAVIAAAQQHAVESGAQVVRVDATSAGAMRPLGRLQAAPVEVGVVYLRPTGRELRQAVIECRVDRRGRAVLASSGGTAQ
jgi:hypothetical protein